DFAGRGPVPLDDLADAAAGDDDELLLLDAGVHAQRVCVSDPEHAGSRAVADVPEPTAVLHGDPARDLSEGSGSVGVVAADAGVGGVRRGGADAERASIPQEAGLEESR